MASKYQKLQNKHVLVIGGTSGIGFGVAEGALASGAQVTVSSSSQSRVDEAVKRLKADFPNSTIAGHATDLSKPTVEQDIEALFSKVGKVDHIVLTAGDKVSVQAVSDLTYEKIIAAGQVRFIAPLLVAKVGSRYLSPGPYSSITFTTGSVSQKPIPGWELPAGFAAGLHGVTRLLAVDLAPIRVNVVAPGPVLSEFWDANFDEQTKLAIGKEVAAKYPTGRIAEPGDVAEAYLFLLKDPSVTGTVVSSNSGALLI
ncbi:hypothetical protein VPNG_06845 [Cytospora leucostoma]|uniref:Uncharacterized protein n=1 Tax=Cytospora leucostoma TaxID=1230097 RepID=A0A423WVT0_9PEZI|nr:hypothetical protein VPNG_06845 [Cytospora leucostoma]